MGVEAHRNKLCGRIVLKKFEQAKLSVMSIESFHIPAPDDALHTFSDWSQSNGAVGGRLELHRTGEDGVIKILHGGFFSARVSQWQTRWLPCEGEALASKMVIHHFKPLLQNSKKTIVHHTDNLPTCQAWEKSKTGAFSNSARIAAFLTEISDLDIEFKHTPGANMGYSDYASCNANCCSEKSCQICKYLQNLVFTADNIIKSITVGDIEKGNVAMPFTQQAAWLQAQSQDKVLVTLIDLIKMGQTPEKKKTCQDFTTLKLLYNLYCKGSLEVSSQGLITVKQTHDTGEQTRAIVVPQVLYPGLAHSIHLKTMHCSKLQLTRLMSRYFYAVGHHRMISEVVDNCHTCLSLKQLPKELFPETTGDIKGFGSHFACDIMVRNSQNILLIREKLTQFTQGCILSKETGQDILTAIITLIADKIPEYGSTIRTDNASTFQNINNLSKDTGSWMNKFNIRIEMGDTFNHNHNPIAENLVKECHKEINKAGYANSTLDQCMLMLVIRNINSRIRDRGLSAKEMCYMRDQATNRNIYHGDDKLKDTQKNKRLEAHNKTTPITVKYDKGDQVMIKDQLTKTKPREKFIVVDPHLDEAHVQIQKQDKKFLSRQYRIPKHQLLKTPRQAAVKAKKKIADTAHLCPIITSEIKIPTHAFNDCTDTDDEDQIYYTVRHFQDENNLSLSVTDSLNSTSSCSSEEDRCLQLGSSSVGGESLSPVIRDQHSEDICVQRYWSIENIIADARNFLQVHPIPPTSRSLNAPVRRSSRVRNEPSRYGINQQTKEERR